RAGDRAEHLRRHAAVGAEDPGEDARAVPEHGPPRRRELRQEVAAPSLGPAGPEPERPPRPRDPRIVEARSEHALAEAVWIDRHACVEQVVQREAEARRAVGAEEDPARPEDAT